jgi:hypothetical protein
MFIVVEATEPPGKLPPLLKAMETPYESTIPDQTGAGEAVDVQSAKL